MRAWPVLLAFIALLAFMPLPVQAKAEAKLLLLHDVQDDGYTYVGNPNQYSFIMLTADGAPTVHKNGKILITQNGVKLYETLGGPGGTDTAHDYDAFNGFVFAFPVAGPYQIHAAMPVGGATLEADFEGFVHDIPNPVNATLKVEAPATVAPGGVGTFTIEVQGPDGKLLPHTDALFEVRRASDGFLVFRTHAHTHDTAMKLDYRFREAGDYIVRIVGYNAYPTPDSSGFVPLSKEVRVKASGAPMPILGAPSIMPPSASVPAQPSGEKYVMFATYDPETKVNPFGNIRLNALVLEAETRTQAAHIDFKAVLTGPQGETLFQSDTLHEYDGNLEVLTQNSVPGEYRLQVEATADGWKGTKDLVFQVVPTSSPIGGAAGPTIITADGLAGVKSGGPSKITFAAKSLAGTPHMHSEIDLQVHAGKAAGAPILLNKLHTHGDGLFTIELVFPTAGDYTLILDAETVHGDPTPAYYYEKVGGALVVPLTVAEGVPLVGAMAPAVTPLESKEDATLPGASLASFLVVGILVFVAARRYA